MSTDIHPQALLATARVQAALLILPRIIGPRQAWVPWFRDGLRTELERIPHPSPTSPHSRLLGSLRRVLINHYCDGMIEEELDFSEIRHSDKLVTGDMYTDISDSLDHLFPDLGGDLWWQKLPSSVSLRASQIPRLHDTSSIPEDTSASEQGSEGGDSPASTIAELYERIDILEECVATGQREQKELMIRVANLEIEVSRLNKDAERSSRLDRSSLPAHHRAGRHRRC